MCLKEFIAGLSVPATLMPFVYATLYFTGPETVRTTPIEFLPLSLPIIYGLWNIVYFKIGKKCPIKSRSPRLFVHGATLGLMLALVGVFIIGLPKIVFNAQGLSYYAPLVVVPLLYGTIWRYLVGPVNNAVKLKDW